MNLHVRNIKCMKQVFLMKPLILTTKTITSKATEKKIAECYRTLNLSQNAKQDQVKEAFLNLAKKYHPDSGSPEADINKFVEIENAFRILTKHNTGASSTDDVEQIVYDIRHTAPQHRQYLSFEGVGHGTPSQRMKQWSHTKAQRAAENVMEHRMSKAIASEKTLMKKGSYGKKHDIKTKYGFDRLVEDLIQESMSKGEFENLSGKGKPLKSQNSNPYVDFTTHKLNEVLINNGFTPEWITMNKEIDNDIKLLKEELELERGNFGPHPLTDEEKPKWETICSGYRDLSKSINIKINTYNLIVPLLNRQRLHLDFESMVSDVLENSPHSVEKVTEKIEVKAEKVQNIAHGTDDLIGSLFRALEEMFKKKNIGN